MPQVTVRKRTGGDDGTLELSDATFGIEPNVAVMHQVVTAQLAARRAGSHSTLTRAEVRGGGAKPWRQKGTGRARQGSIRSPQWRGGGVAFGPKPRDYSQRTPKKMVRLALRSALSDRAAEDKVLVVDAWDFDTPRTKDAVALLRSLGVDGRALVVVPAEAEATWKSFRNLPLVHVVSPGELNAYDVLVSDVVIFSRDTLPADQVPSRRAARPAASDAPEAADLVRQAKAAKAQKVAAAKVADAVGEPAADPAPDAPSSSTAPATDPADEYDAHDVEGESDMPSDLPNRPPRSGDEERTVIDPKDRVKSAADKLDPRFEAARIKADKEADLRARQAKAQARSADDPADEADDEAEAPAPSAEKSAPFSFNNSVQPKDD
jgi:large subunit ribosomal protein L4